MRRHLARRTPYGAAADLPRLDLDEQVPDSIRPRHRSALPSRGEQVVVRYRLGEAEHQNTPARLAFLIDAVDLKSDTGTTDELSQRTSRRGTENHAAVAILIGHRQDLWAIPGQETDPAGAVLRQELFAIGLRQFGEAADGRFLVLWCGHNSSVRGVGGRREWLRDCRPHRPDRKGLRATRVEQRVEGPAGILKATQLLRRSGPWQGFDRRRILKTCLNG